MKIEAVIVCHNYSDFLEQTLPENIPYFDRLVVVTHHDDKATQGLCSKYSIECVKTSCMHDNGDAWNKGKCINLGLGHLKGLDWILHLDADIVLPYDFKNLLVKANLQRENIYGADRLNVYGYDHWEKHKHNRVPSHKSHYFVDAIPHFPLGSRIIHQDHGYTPIGYFQLWHKSQGKRYPTHQGNAEHTDVLFAAQWARQHRILLPEVIVCHLESASGPTPMGANWGGRKTPHFGPGCCPKCHKHHPKHSHCHPPQPYCPK